jgi:hypothetical protein
MVPENLLEVVSLLATCRKGKQGEDEGEERRQWKLFPFILRFIF